MKYSKRRTAKLSVRLSRKRRRKTNIKTVRLHKRLNLERKTMKFIKKGGGGDEDKADTTRSDATTSDEDKADTTPLLSGKAMTSELQPDDLEIPINPYIESKQNDKKPEEKQTSTEEKQTSTEETQTSTKEMQPSTKEMQPSTKEMQPSTKNSVEQRLAIALSM